MAFNPIALRTWSFTASKMNILFDYQINRVLFNRYQVLPSINSTFMIHLSYRVTDSKHSHTLSLFAIHWKFCYWWNKTPYNWPLDINLLTNINNEDTTIINKYNNHIKYETSQLNLLNTDLEVSQNFRHTNEFFCFHIHCMPYDRIRNTYIRQLDLAAFFCFCCCCYFYIRRSK